MSAAVILGVAILLGYASAIPTPCATSCSSSSSSSTTVTKSTSCTSYSFFQNYYESSYQCSFIDTSMCSSIGINSLYDGIPNLIIEDLEREYLQAKCRLLEQYSVFPINLASTLHTLSEEDLTFDYIIAGGSPSSLFTLQQLAAQGNRILLVDNGILPPSYSNSLYMKWSMLSSQYVRPYEGLCKKKYYASNVIGGFSVYGFDQFDYGSQSYYEQLAKYDERFGWDYAQKYYQSYSSSSTTTTKETSTEVSQSSCGGLSISKTVRETSVTRSFSQVFTELGYSDCGQPLTCGCKPGFYHVPRIVGENDSEFLTYNIFKNIQSLDNIRMITGYELEQLIYENGRICGCQVMTSNGPIIIRNKMDIIFGMDTIPLAKLFYKSGFGCPNVLSSLGLPVVQPLPYIGQNLMFSPIYIGSFMKFKRGSFIYEFENDYSCYSSIFGSSGMSASSYQSSYSAYISVGGSSYSNAKIQFYSFNYYQKRTLEVFMRHYAQYSEEVCSYFLELIYEYDIVFFATQLLEYQSRGSLIFKDSIDSPILDFGFYKHEQDLKYMIEAVKLTQQIGMTKVLSGFGGEVLQVPLSSCSSSPFSDEYITETLSQFTIPSYHNCGGFAFGTDVASSVIDINFQPHGLLGARIIGPGVSPHPWFGESIALSTFYSNYLYTVISSSSSSSSVSVSSSSSSASGISGSSTSVNSETSSVTRELGSPSGLSGIPTPGCGGIPTGPDCDCDGIPDICDDMPNVPGPCDVIPTPGCSSGIGSGISSSSYEATEIGEESSSYNSSSIGSGLGGVSQSASSYEAESVSAASESAQVVAGGAGGVARSASSYESESVSAASESSQVVAGAGGVASQYNASEYEAESSNLEQTVATPCGVSHVEKESSSVSASNVESSCSSIKPPCSC